MSSDSSSDSEADNSEINQQVVELETNLEKSPYYYEGHVQLIKLLRQQGDLDKAREARQNMRKTFPLTEDLWLEWVRDEMPLTGLIAESALELRLLFEAAAEDYLSVQMWVEYSQFAVDKMSVVPEGVEFPRDVFERAVVACGLHVSQSGLLWDAYLEFEKAMLRSLQDMQMENLEDESLKEQVVAQFEKVDKLFKRRLAVTHIGMEEAFLDYQQSISEVAITEDSLPAYARAKKLLAEYLPFEAQLATSDPPTVESYRCYLTHLVSSKADLMLVNTLYQRAVAHHCLDSELWLQYLQFLDKHFTTAGGILLPGYRLGVRNCTWESRFWLGLLRGLERAKSHHQEIIATFEKALVDNFTSSADHLTMWLAYCDYYRRQMDMAGSSHSRQELVALFQRARSKLLEDFGKQGDPLDTLSRYHSNVVKDVAEGRVIWEDIMTRHGKEAGYWMDYITYIRHREGADGCRKLFHKAVNSVTDDPQRVCEAYLQFEREEGSLEHFEAALCRTASQTERLRERREKAAEKEAQGKEEGKKKKKLDKKTQKKDSLGGGRAQEPSHGKKPAGRASFLQDSDEEGGQVGGGRVQEPNQRKRPAGRAFFLRESEGEGGKVGERPGSAAKKPRVQGVAAGTTSETDTFLPASTTPPAAGDSEKGVVSAVPMETSGAESEPEGPKEQRTEGPKEQRTVFVSNLPQTATKNQLRERFTECGEIVEVRLVHSRAKFNRMNTFAYIEFSSPAPVSDALSLDHTLFMEKNIYVSPFKEKKETASGDAKSEIISKSTVYVNNLQKDVVERDLEELFKQCGEVKQVRLVKNLHGRSKGYAYVEFVVESSARVAIQKLDSHLMGLKKIGVAMSNPPKTAETLRERGVASGGVARKSEGVFAVPSFIPHRGRKLEEAEEISQVPKSKISLMPRALARRSGKEGMAKEGVAKEGVAKEVKVESAEAKKANLSNDDFRKLFSKQ